MYQTLILYHSICRWLVLLSLLYALIRAARGKITGKAFSGTDNAVRHWTATIAHIQLVIGMVLYTQSPVIRYFWSNFREARESPDSLFFGLIHILMMLAAIVLITIGSARAKRMPADKDKFNTMLLWYGLGLLLIIIAIPWPFSLLAHRPYFR